MGLSDVMYGIGHRLLSGSRISRHVKARNAAMRIIRATRRGTIAVQGHRMIIDDSPLGMGLELLVFGCYERPETDFVMGYIGEGDTVIDVGANIGYHTLLLARKVGRSGTVYGFEPEAGNFEILRNNVDNNGYRNCTPPEQGSV